MLPSTFKKYFSVTKNPSDIFKLWVELFDSNSFELLRFKIRFFELNPHSKIINGLTPLHIACIQGNKEAIKFLLQYNVDINAKSDRGRTPIEEALTYDYKDCASLLLDEGAYLHNSKRIVPEIISS